MTASDLYADLKTEFPRYLVNFQNILKKPGSFPLTLIEGTENEGRERILFKAFIYFFISNALALFWIVSSNSEEIFSNPYKLIVNTVIGPLVLLVMLGIAMSTAWAITGIKGSFSIYVALLAYHFGTLLNAYNFVYLIIHGIYKWFAPEKYEAYIQKTYMEHDYWNVDADFSNVPDAFLILSGLALLVFAIVWLSKSWAAYRQLHKASKRKSLVAKLSFLALFLVIIWLQFVLDNLG